MENYERPNHIFKMMVIGNSGVGKSCLVYRYTENSFSENYISSPDLVDFKTKTTSLDNRNIKLEIWDTTGKERYRTIMASYYRKCHFIIVVYNVTDRDSYENVRKKVEDIVQTAKNMRMILVGNKCDMPEDQRQVTFQ